MSDTRVNIHLNLSGSIALTDFVKIAAMIQPDNYNMPVAEASSAPTPSPVAEQPVAATNPVTQEAPAEPETDETDGVLDAHGHPWSAELHASTKSQTKEGLWRMKVGVSRPDPMPGFPKTETPSETSTPSQANTDAAGATEPAGSSQTADSTSAAAASPDDDDEFAAFRAAAAKADANNAAAAASVPERKWTDADLGKLCNQAAVKLGDPAPVKAEIAKFVPEGKVAHSRNVPADKRAAFVAAVEKAAGIEFAG